MVLKHIPVEQNLIQLKIPHFSIYLHRLRSTGNKIFNLVENSVTNTILLERKNVIYTWQKQKFLQNLNTVWQLDLDARLTLQSEQHFRTCVDVEQCFKTAAVFFVVSFFLLFVSLLDRNLFAGLLDHAIKIGIISGFHTFGIFVKDSDMFKCWIRETILTKLMLCFYVQFGVIHQHPQSHTILLSPFKILITLFTESGVNTNTKWVVRHNNFVYNVRNNNTFNR